MNENIVNLVETYCREGCLNVWQFHNDPEEMQKFLQENGMVEPYSRYQAARDAYERAADPEEAEAHYQNAVRASEDIRGLAKEKLFESGLDMDSIYGKEPTQEEAREMFFDQLDQMGIDRETIKNLKLDNIERVLYENRPVDFSFAVKDTPENRRAFEEQGIYYDAREGKLHAEASIRGQKGLAIDDTPESRRLLDKNEIQYIRMATGKNPYLGEKGSKNKLLIPETWMAPVYTANNHLSVMENNFMNTQLYHNMKPSVVLLATLGMFNPMLFWAAILTLKVSGYYNTKVQPKERPSFYEQKALKDGLTVFHPSPKGDCYFYEYKGNLCSINAHDVRIPSVINGVRLNLAEQDAFRRGELVKLKDKNGHSFEVRIDVTKPNLVQNYYRQFQSDRLGIPVPDRNSTKEQKLDYIAKMGYQGVQNIYGKTRLNTDRDDFLRENGLKAAFDFCTEAMSRPDGKNTEDFKKYDAEMKDTAQEVVNSQTNSRGRAL